MKTSLILNSDSRNLFGVTIRQETKNAHLNLSDLQNAYSVARTMYGWTDKKVSEILSYNDNAERIYFILEKQGFINTGLNVFMELVKSKGLVKVLKSLGCYVTRGRGDNKSTSCNPYIWVLVAMEMNPRLYAEVVTWLTDKLILNRIEAGDLYKDLSKAISNFRDVDYSALGRALNFLIFDKHEAGIRNTGTEQQLKELYRLELNLAFIINSGFIKSFSELIEYLRSLWNKKQQKSIA